MLNLYEGRLIRIRRVPCKSRAYLKAKCAADDIALGNNKFHIKVHSWGYTVYYEPKHIDLVCEAVAALEGRELPIRDYLNVPPTYLL